MKNDDALGLTTVTFSVEELLALAELLVETIDPYEASARRNAAYRVVEKAVVVESVLTSAVAEPATTH